MKKQVTLQEYIDFLGITQEEAAKQIGISRTHLNLVLTGKSQAGRKFLTRVLTWSNGRVDLVPFMMFQPEKKAA